jgi:DNA-binding NarL/FixJ family response regulator
LSRRAPERSGALFVQHWSQAAVPPWCRSRKAGEAQIHEHVFALVDAESLHRECFAEVLQAAFSRTLVIAAADISGIPAIGIPVALGLLKVASPYTPGSVAQRVKVFEQHLPGTPIIVIGCGSEGFALEAIKAGARGVLLVTDPVRIAIATVRLVLAGGIYYPLRFPSELLSTSDADGQRSSPSPFPSPSAHGPSLGPTSRLNRTATGDQTTQFTARELDVLAALQRGRSNKWIARQLNLSENTVKVHIRHIMQKLKATNRTQAVMIYSQSAGPWEASRQETDALTASAA